VNRRAYEVGNAARTIRDGGRREPGAAPGSATAPEPATAPEGIEPRPRVTKTFSSRLLHKLQHRHFFLFNLAPLIGTVVAVALIPFSPPSKVDLLGCLLLWGLTLFCVVTGFHRYFTHRSFSAHASIRTLLQIGGLTAAQGSLISWVAIHRRHHECSDEAGDPHSPMPDGHGVVQRLRGLLHSQFLWMYEHEYPNVELYARDLLRDSRVVKLDQYYYHFVAFGVVLPGLVSASFNPTPTAFLQGVLWGGLVRIFAVGNTIGAVNAVLHTFGQRRFETSDNSRNSFWMAFLTFGDSYHNNHHAFPSSASAGLNWYHPDPAFWVIRFLSYLGLTSDIKVPSKHQIEQRLGRGKANVKQSER
jgi:stearoyl-CoA desaturase (Delta-9 desaturase)